jgi:hypothetical protein
MNIINQFLNFDKLMGQGLVKIVYYLGLIAIALGVLFGILGGLGAMGYNAATGLGMVVGALLGGVIAVCFLRFACELYIAIFRISDDLSAIRAGGTSMTPKA